MNTSVTSYNNMDDLVFENRNHEYGAYRLRRKYERRLYVALVSTIGTFGLAMTAPELFREEVAVVETLTGPVIVMDQPRPIAPAKPMEPIKVTPPPPAPPVRNLTPVLVDRDVETELPTNEELSRPNIITPNIGDGTLAYIDEGDFGDIAVAEPEEVKEEKRFVRVEIMPEFQGDLNKYLSKNLRYPEAAVSQGIEGKVYLTFAIAKDGSIFDIKVLKGISKECDEEAVRVISKMPAWKPGRQSGDPVTVQFSLPISFMLHH